MGFVIRNTTKTNVKMNVTLDYRKVGGTKLLNDEVIGGGIVLKDY